MESLLPAERRQKILDIIARELTIRVSSLSEMLGVSEMTIRRDLDYLGERGLAERTHGGAVFIKRRTPGKFQYQSSVQTNPDERTRIARAAATLIEPHDMVYLGEGASTAEMMHFINPDMPFTVFTNNLGVVPQFQGQAAELIVLGGAYTPETHALAGPITMEQIRQINASKVFLGVDGLSLRSGLTTPNLDIAAIERSMIQYTRGKVIAMADNSKFGLVAEVVVAPIHQIDIIVTDQKIPGGFQKDLLQMGVEVIVAQ
ncbi:MAG: DeoR/GlpR transcriptional regulator [Deltaproteobacteria bacterium]|nr:MAG: DeoR/GlpR transcriptional regulator [Deltaproteobacteria bacterium]